MKKKFGVVGAVLFGLATIVASGGCSENAAATAKCHDSKDGDSCSKCCTENKATGNSFTSGGGCTCRGGGE